MPEPTEPTVAEPEPALTPGTRIRHRRHPELTGRIENIERQDNGHPSAIPYCLDWDDSDRAHDVLGMLFNYGTDDSIKALEP